MVLQLGAASPLPAFATALTAWLDGEHRVSLAACDGQFEVVLARDVTNRRMAPTHRHSPLCRMLIMLAPATGRSAPDHVIGFAASTVSIMADDAIILAGGGGECVVRPSGQIAVRQLPPVAACLRRALNMAFTEPIATVVARVTILLV